jgi:hypothetical protein
VLSYLRTGKERKCRKPLRCNHFGDEVDIILQDLRELKAKSILKPIHGEKA